MENYAIASRGIGRVDENGKIVDYKLLSYDIVSLPSYDIVSLPKISLWRKIVDFLKGIWDKAINWLWKKKVK